MANVELPEDVVVRILQRLPVESLIRFSCVSKRWRSVILSDPQFAKSHYALASKQRTLRRRLLLSTDCQIESLDLQTPSFGDHSSVRKLTCPFKSPNEMVSVLGSSNGLVFLSLDSDHNFSLWNPSTGFFQRLPDPGFRPELVVSLCSGFGYLSALNDYKVFVATTCVIDEESDGEDDQLENWVEIFSLRTQLWRRIDPPLGNLFNEPGALLNDALHWISTPIEPGPAIVAFDLTKEEVRTMPLPILDGMCFSHLGVSFEGCLHVTSQVPFAYECIGLWVMREYGVPGSWIKLFNINFESLERIIFTTAIVVMEKSVVLGLWRGNDHDKNLMIKVDHGNGSGENNLMIKVDHGDGSLGEYTLPAGLGLHDVIEYEESLLWINE